MSREPFAPGDPAKFARPVGTVGEAIDDLAARPELVVDGFTASGFLVVTGATSSDLAQSGASADGTGSVSTQGADITTAGGNIVTGPGLVDGRDVSADGSKLDSLDTLVRTTGVQLLTFTLAKGASDSAILAPTYPGDVSAASNARGRGVTLPCACSLVMVTIQVNVTAESGSPNWGVLLYRNGSGFAFPVSASVGTGANKIKSFEYARGTHEFAAGDTFSADRFRSGGTGLTTEDVVVNATFVVDELYEGA